MKRRDLTEDEKKLWEALAGSVKPLPAKAKAAPPQAKKTAVKERPRAAPALPPMRHSEPLTRGNYAGIDKRNAERFRKGEYDIDATLDLHGLSRDKAFAALEAFLEKQYARKSRCLLVITGKGEILREELPRWLNDTALRAMVLAFDAAKQHHGGSGAYYILLKRQRG